MRMCDAAMLEALFALVMFEHNLSILKISLDHDARNNSWQQSVTEEERKRLVDRLVQTIFPAPDLTSEAMYQQRVMSGREAYARKVENDVFESARSRSEYYHQLAQKILRRRDDTSGSTS